MTTPVPANPAPPARLYPAAQPVMAPPNVPLGTDFTEHYAAGGYPDIESAGLSYAAGQRAAARAAENRNQLTTNPPGPYAMSPAPASSSAPGAAPIVTGTATPGAGDG